MLSFVKIEILLKFTKRLEKHEVVSKFFVEFSRKDLKTGWVSQD